MATGVLIIGLDNLSNKIIPFFKKASFKLYGFDFEVDKIDFYKNDIENSVATPLFELLKQADIIVLNTYFSKYENIFRLSPFIKINALIFNTNTCKNYMAELRKIILTKDKEFIPCNFSLFPNEVVINYDKFAKMSAIRELSELFNSLSIKTSVLDPLNNDLIFSNILHIPFLLEKIFLKKEKINLFSRDILSTLIFEDIILNKNLLVKNLLNLYNFLNNKNFNLFDLIKDNYISNKVINNEINGVQFKKLLFEKIIERTLINKGFEYYSKQIFNFNSDLYSFETLNSYYIKNKENLEIYSINIKDKINNLISFLESEQITISKLQKYLDQNSI